ncbi:MAG TPA: hypothetical protein VGJ94_06835 [Syntrophorhabdaceae bacterium]|jgi:hypothetical protein
MTESKYGKYIVTDLKSPNPPEFEAEYAKWAKRILWMDNNVVDGASQMNCAWYLRPPVPPPAWMKDSHAHDADEILGFFGSNPDDPYDLGAELELRLEDEQHTITRSCLIFVPGGMRHCPLIIKRVDRPIFHLSTVTIGRYRLLEEGEK